jgi:hypothetical protein
LDASCQWTDALSNSLFVSAWERFPDIEHARASKFPNGAAKKMCFLHNAIG